MTTNANLYDKIVIKSPYDPRNLQGRMYKGFSTISADAVNFSLFDYQLIKQDILNHFFTRQGERLMNATYGCVIWDLLYEPLTEDLKYLIKTNVEYIANSDPRVSAKEILISTYETGIQVQITLEYKPYNLNEQLTLQFDQSNNLLLGQ